MPGMSIQAHFRLFHSVFKPVYHNIITVKTSLILVILKNWTIRTVSIKDFFLEVIKLLLYITLRNDVEKNKLVADI